MRKRVVWILCLLVASTASLSAESLSYTGTLSSPEDVFTTNFTLTATGTVSFQTWGFGGGTNAAGQAIDPGGFDPLLTLFSGSDPTASILLDGSGNPLADADTLSNPPWSFVGNCPTAGTVSIGTSDDCGDVYLQATLDAGMYTLVLTDANYLPNAIFDGGTLDEGFVDFTAGVFQTCDTDANACITPGGNYAVDIVSRQLEIPSTVPEPPTLSLLCIGLVILAGAKHFAHPRLSPHP